MIEQIASQIIKDLGPTGVLILGLFWVAERYFGRMAGNIETLNHNSTKLIEVLERGVDRICDKINGQN